MAADTTNLLLTGPPGCGKTTIVRRTVELLAACRLAGFYTEEVREHGNRVGFRAVGLNGRSIMLAHVGHKSRHRVGRYGVDLAALEQIVAEELQRPRGDVDLFVVDEIGKMECFSNAFIQAVRALLDGSVPMLGTIAGMGGGFIAAIKARPDVEILTVLAANRGWLPEELARRLGG